MSLRATIDIGSNSVLLLIAKVENEKIHVIKDVARVTSLGYLLDKTGEFAKTSMDATFAALEEYRQLIDSESVPLENIVVTATEASRVANNAAEFYTQVSDKLGLDVLIINAFAEAYYTARGVLTGSSTSMSEDFILMDIGGASTELIVVSPSPFLVKSTVSLPVGSVRATDWLSEGSYKEKMRDILEKSHLCDYDSEKVFCVAGTMTSLATMLLKATSYSAESINSKTFLVSELNDLHQNIANQDTQELLKQYPHLGKRSTSIVGGLTVARDILSKLGAKTIEVSTLGQRYGTMIERLIKDEFITNHGLRK
jgi:exopolyphosphatase / guanosine-5'-triphosphate,3'-diphosphate pyrophosphatase